MNRPVGVTILGVLAIVAGAFGIIGAIASAVGAFALAALGAGALASGARGAGFAAAGVAIILVFAVWLLILGGLDIIFGIGALRLKGWAWTLGVVLMAISIISDVVQVFAAHGSFFGTIIGVAISLFILYYLFTPEVKAAFGKTGVGPEMPSLTGQSAAPASQSQYGTQPPAQQPPAQPYSSPPQQQPYGAPPSQQPYGTPPAQPPTQPYAPPAPPAQPPAEPPATPPTQPPGPPA